MKEEELHTEGFTALAQPIFIIEGQYSTITLQYNISLLLEEDFQEERKNRTEIEFKKKSDTISNKIDPINLDAF